MERKTLQYQDQSESSKVDTSPKLEKTGRSKSGINPPNWEQDLEKKS
jgi:hypothetical protein